jgi:SAM-dependent methyltransferase
MSSYNASPKPIDSKQPSSGFDPAFFSQLAEVEADSFWFNGRNRIITWAMKEFFPEAVDFLEIGCGTGFVLTALAKELPSLKLSGSELFPEGLAYASKRVPNANLFQLDALNIPFEKSFDVIGAFDVLEHIEDDTRVLSEMFKAVRPGGGIVVTVPQHMFLWSQSDTQAHHCRRYSLAELECKVQQAGFSIVTSTSFVALLLPLMFASRLRQKLFPSEYNFLSELRVRGVTGLILENVLKLELSLIKRRMSFPCGGSLLMVAQRLPSTRT